MIDFNVQCVKLGMPNTQRHFAISNAYRVRGYDARAVVQFFGIDKAMPNPDTKPTEPKRTSLSVTKAEFTQAIMAIAKTGKLEVKNQTADSVQFYADGLLIGAILKVNKIQDRILFTYAD